MRKYSIPAILLVVIVVIGISIFMFTGDSDESTQPSSNSDDKTENGAESEENQESKELVLSQFENRELEAVDFDFAPTPSKEKIIEQQEIEQTIIEESEGSTFEEPYVKLDPYDRAPLSALVIFETEEPSKVSFTVQGNEEDVNITKTFDEYKTYHQLPILGLYPNQSNTIVINLESESGGTKEQTINVQTEPLPDYIPSISIETINEEKVDIKENDLTFAIPSTKYIYGFDKNGDIRWYSSKYNSHVFKELSNGNFLYLGKDSNGGSSYNRLLEVDLMGKVYKAFKVSEEAATSEAEGMESTLIHHDAYELPNGNWLLTVNDGSDEYMEDAMIEMEPDTGQVVKMIDLKELFPAETYENYPPRDDKDGKIDWFHQNSVVFDESDGSIIISGRNQDIVMKIDYFTDEIIWILAHPDGFTDEFKEEYLIEGIGENFKYPGAQHDATILPDFDNDSDTIDLLIYDNNVTVTRGDEELSKQYSAGTQYRINEQTKEAEIIWSYGKERGEELFTNIVGSAKYLEDTGNRLIDFGHVASGERSHIIEATDDDQPEVVLEAVISGFPSGSWVYRSQRYSIYNDQWENNFSIFE